MDWQYKTDEFGNLFHPDIKWEGHVVAHQIEPWVVVQMVGVALRAGEIAAEIRDLVALF